MIKLNCESVIVCYDYTVEVSECDSVKLWKYDSVEELNCRKVIVWKSYTAEV